MSGTCVKHLFEQAEDNCRHCGLRFCGDCLVYSFGPKRAPFCIACAITAGGVRSTSANRAASRRELRAAAKERKSRRKGERQQVSEALANVMAEEPVPPTRAEAAVDPALDVSWVQATV